ncbi:MAG: hypothetical protein IT215_03685 [Chitinophagaceae bacterium]|nr:hypothetical protein [Chitinophagaceae bacterium]
MQVTEIYLYISLIIAIIFLFILLNGITRHVPKVLKPKTEKQPKKEEKNDADILEVFDYLGLKIIHENGKYTVNEKGKLKTYNSWIELPSIYQKMIKELDNRSLQKKAGDYFLETINGVHYLTFPNGKRKKYKNLHDIPAHIRKAVGK